MNVSEDAEVALGKVPELTALFWAALVPTRPLGAVVGDYLDKPLTAGGLALSRFSASAVLSAFIARALFVFNHRASPRAH